MKMEHKLILKSVLLNKNEEEIAEISTFLNKELNWVEIAGILFNHRLGGYFYKGLTVEQRWKIPNELRKTLELLIDSQKRHQEDAIHELCDINNVLVESRINFAALKGAFFGCEMYEVGSRRSNDIDLLVYEKDLDILDTCLRNKGYIQSNMPDGEMVEATKKEKIIQRMNYHDLVPYVKETENGVLELDINFLFDSKDNMIDEIVYKMGTKCYEGAYKIVGLNYYTNLAFLCVHFYREATNTIWTEGKRDVVLYKIVDIMNYIRFYDINIDRSKIVDIFNELNISEKAYFTFKVISEFFEDSFISDMLAKLSDYAIDGEEMTKIYDYKNKTTICRSETFYEKAFGIVYR